MDDLKNLDFFTYTPLYEMTLTEYREDDEFVSSEGKAFRHSFETVLSNGKLVELCENGSNI